MRKCANVGNTKQLLLNILTSVLCQDRICAMTWSQAVHGGNPIGNIVAFYLNAHLAVNARLIFLSWRSRTNASIFNWKMGIHWCF